MNTEKATPELFAALAKAQAEVENATKGSTNPHFKSKYADLAATRWSQSMRSLLRFMLWCDREAVNAVLTTILLLALLVFVPGGGW